jgi:hypothetical protein
MLSSLNLKNSAGKLWHNFNTCKGNAGKLYQHFIEIWFYAGKGIAVRRNFYS